MLPKRAHTATWLAVAAAVGPILALARPTAEGAFEANKECTLYHIRVWGPRAAFVDPDFAATASRTYPTITPTAARGVLETIIWQRDHDNGDVAFDWVVHSVATCAPIRVEYTKLNERTETGPRARYSVTQRTRAYLMDVDYVLQASLVARRPQMQGKYTAKFEQMAAAGASRTQIHLGQREYHARYEIVQPDTYKPIDWNSVVPMTLWTYPKQGRPQPLRDVMIRVTRGVYHVPAEVQPC